MLAPPRTLRIVPLPNNPPLGGKRPVATVAAASPTFDCAVAHGGTPLTWVIAVPSVVAIGMVAISNISTYPSRVRSRPLTESATYTVLRNSAPVAGILGFVQLLSTVANVAPAAVGVMDAFHTSLGDRNKLKSNTSTEFLPSRIRTFTALPCVVVLTTEIKVTLPPRTV